MQNMGIFITAEFDGRRVESLLKNEFKMSDSYISRLKRRDSGIMLNGIKAYTTAVVHEGDELTAEICDPEAAERAVPMAAELSVPWQDDYIAVVDKPAGMAVHQSTRDPLELTLENAFAANFPKRENFHPVSRLDRGTTGLMTVAKSGYIHERLKRLLHTEHFRREYLGIAVGRVLPENGIIELPIGMAENSRYKRAVRADGAPSLTEYITLGHYGKYTLLRLIPHTGRTHQLRVHMSGIGYPLAGDWLYGKQEECIGRPALHSSELWLTHPMTGEKLHIVSELPEDMKRLLHE